MKCVKKGGEIQRVTDERASTMVKSGWAYCPKSEWKTTSRNATGGKKAQKVPAEKAEKAEKADELKESSKKSDKSKEYRSSKYKRKNENRESGE